MIHFAQISFWSLLLSILLFVGMPVAFWRWAKGTEEGPIKLLFKAGFTVAWIFSIIMLGAGGAEGFALAIALLGGIPVSLIWAPTLGRALSDGIGGLYTGGSTEIEARPIYSFATAKLNRGDVTGAIAEVRKQLGQFPEDYQGLMLLARIFVERQNNLSEASEILERIGGEAHYAPGEQVMALNQLADWRLKYGLDSHGAREALECIERQFPGSEAGYMATQRLAHLTPQEMLDERKQPNLIEVLEHVGRVGLAPHPREFAVAPGVEPGLRARQLVEHLDDHPQDFEARVELAAVYHKHYGRSDLAIDQLEQLINLPNQLIKNAVHCLHQIADIQMEKMEDPASAKLTLERIIKLFPQTSAAENALTRITYLAVESKGKRPGGVVKMGSYEQNIGLNPRSSEREGTL